jgi:Transposase DDE domain
MFDKLTPIGTIIKEVSGMPKSGREFLIHIIGIFMSIQSRINFLQLARHSFCYGEQACRNQFERYVDFATINAEYIQQKGFGRYIATFDLTYLRKAGKSTDGTGRYWSSVAQRSIWGLEMGLLSIVDIYRHTAYHLDAIQTPSPAERSSKDISLPDHYAQSIVYNKSHLQALSCHFLVVDAYFAKKDFIDRIITQTGLAIITRLRSDADCKYCYHGPKRVGRGAPKKYDGKVDWSKPDPNHFTLAYEDCDLKVYHAVLYCVFLKRSISLSFCQQLNDDTSVKSYKIYVCTDIRLTALLIKEYYQARFQQEFLIRDAKQFTGLQDCQARSTNKIEYHANTALTAINVAKFEHWLNDDKQQKPFSMADVKTLYHNTLLIERFFQIFPDNAELIKNNPKIKELYHFGFIAA